MFKLYQLCLRTVNLADASFSAERTGSKMDYKNPSQKCSMLTKSTNRYILNFKDALALNKTVIVFICVDCRICIGDFCNNREICPY